MSPIGQILRDLHAGASTVDSLSLRLKIAPEIVRQLLEHEAAAINPTVESYPLHGTELRVWKLTGHGRSSVD